MNDATHPALKIERLTVCYGATPAVQQVDLEVRRGELLALVGSSGCGKTTLLRAIAGFERASAGQIEIDGERVEGEAQHLPPERRQLGMVFQQGALFPHLSVQENVGFGLRRGERASRTQEILEFVGLQQLAARFPDQLSGGQQQLVALARALAPRPRLVLLDEPFASLDAERRERIRDEVRDILRRAGATAICVTHDQDEALSIADRVAVMQEGKIQQVGTPEQVYRRPRTLAVAQFIGDGALVPVRVEAGRVKTGWGVLGTEMSDGEATLLIRPEALQIVANANAADAVEAVVVRSQFRGQDRLYDLQGSDGQRYRVRDDARTARYSDGAAVLLAPRHAELWLLRENDAAGAAFDR